MVRLDRTRRSAALLAGLVASIIWSTSFLVTNAWLPGMGPLTIAGLRYTVAGVLLLPLVVRVRSGSNAAALPWARLSLIGVSAYTIGNVALFAALATLSPTAVTLLMGLAPHMVLAISVTLGERPYLRQLIGVMLTLMGSSLFFSANFALHSIGGVLLASIGVIAYTFSSLLTRKLARADHMDTTTLTAVPLVIGGGLSLLLAFPIDGPPRLSMSEWTAIVMLTLVHTIIGYVLYTQALRVLTALEANILLNLSRLGTAVLAWVLFGERLTSVQWCALGVTIVGVTLVQWQHRQSKGRHQYERV